MLFDEWPERYNQWFETPIGKLVKETEGKLVYDMLNPKPGEKILDAGCGTGIFTLDYLNAGAEITGLDISRPMLMYAVKNITSSHFSKVQADMLFLPFKDNSFDKAISITALEFIEDARSAIDELFRVTRPGGCVVVATLNSLSPWAERRKADAQKGEDSIFENAFFRSPHDLLALSPFKGTAKTVIHFNINDDPARAKEIEQQGQSQGLDTGAFAAVCWEKPR